MDGASDECIEINAGGTKFITKRETLLRGGGNYFSNALKNETTKQLFVDRDAKRFEVVLNFMRTGRVSLNGLQLRDILEEAHFFGIAKLRNACIQFVSVTVNSSSLFGQNDRDNKFLVQGLGVARRFREDKNGDFIECQNYVNELIAAGWTIDSVTTDHSNHIAFHWVLSRVKID